MTILVLGVLAVLWVIVLAPPALRALQQRGGLPAFSIPRISGFRGRGPANGIAPITGPVPVVSIGADGSLLGPAAAMRDSAAAKRRRGMILLGSAVMVSFLLAIVISSPVVWVFQLGIDIVFVAFLVKAAQLGGTRRPGMMPLRTLERRSSAMAGVSYLPQRPIVEPSFRRSSSF